MFHLITSLLIYIVSSQAIAEEEKKLPLFELGLASIFVYSPDYPASNESSPRILFVPTYAYRGGKIRTDRRGTRARFFKNKKIVLDLGTGFSLPASSKGNQAREDMDDLGFILELGPRLIYTFFENDTDSLLLLVPFRFAVTTDFSFTKAIGTRFNPELEYRRIFKEKYILKLGLETNFVSEKYADYIYEVETKFVTADRSRFNARDGYLGSSLTLAFIYRGSRFSYFTGLIYNRFDDSVNEESPLFKAKETTGVAFGINYFFHQSTRKGGKAAGAE